MPFLSPKSDCPVGGSDDEFQKWIADMHRRSDPTESQIIQWSARADEEFRAAFPGRAPSMLQRAKRVEFCTNRWRHALINLKN